MLFYDLAMIVVLFEMDDTDLRPEYKQTISEYFNVPGAVLCTVTLLAFVSCLYLCLHLNLINELVFPEDFKGTNLLKLIYERENKISGLTQSSQSSTLIIVN